MRWLHVQHGANKCQVDKNYLTPLLASPKRGGNKNSAITK